jgi:hypothetical protein
MLIKKNREERNSCHVHVHILPKTQSPEFPLSDLPKSTPHIATTFNFWDYEFKGLLTEQHSELHVPITDPKSTDNTHKILTANFGDEDFRDEDLW